MYLRVCKAAKACRVSERTIHRYVAGGMRCVRDRRGRLLVSVGDVRAVRAYKALANPANFSRRIALAGAGGVPVSGDELALVRARYLEAVPGAAGV